TGPADNIAGSMADLHDTTERLPHFLQIWRPPLQPAQTGLGVAGYRGEGLSDFMGDRGRELAHRGHAIGVRELHLDGEKSPLVFSSFRLRTLALGQIKHEGDTLISLFVERG